MIKYFILRRFVQFFKEVENHTKTPKGETHVDVALVHIIPAGIGG